ncbi:metalloregulator ArsR/SmtB family transcription factor [Roseibacterium beibuensis]|uniref:ArsR/SmtB family transcription factor n=1 Tax=[Roseibacterium] beibuensis TaxID=1193142 RepID=UPI00217CF24D|nr:metalloregulator ArsR/SmtB family transcription factor [Roseibacterium beibuensis]MCS6627031.1 metalloregulator ArsR/SmtB family transcription factor [Roseibacterium beibuensis]
MDTAMAVRCFSALGQDRRLDVFRLLIQAGPEGLKAGEIAQRLGQPASTMSSHLRILTEAGLVASQRKGREIHFTPEIDRVRALVLFLVADCCGGRADRCEPLLAELLPCCP